MMDKRIAYLDRYLENTERLFQALAHEDLSTVNRCLDQNLELMKGYDQMAPNANRSPGGEPLRVRMEAIRRVNERCVLFTEDRCRTLRDEIEQTDKNHNGVRRYGVKQNRPPAPKFIDNRT